MWTPSTRDLELLCEHASARIPAAVTAKALGVTPEHLRELARKLAKGRANVAVPPEPEADSTPLSMRARVFK
jgi:hypothetical protein